MEGERDDYYEELQSANHRIEDLVSELLHAQFDLEDALAENEELKNNHEDLEND